ncbi:MULTISPECIES: BON domain-containing protein [unclassified Paraburkholderia]|uniref:BON domain-containing protein n=1 Tax=unclassified Paraburkholderia TaxID=2615204 RepID=UPI002AB6F90C|nr:MULTISPECIES: BON domain-containing protein [unclassified Paraburkholderia]
MNLRNQALTGVFAVLLSTSVLAQTAAPAAPTKEQVRAQMKADKAANKAFSKTVWQAVYKTKGLEDTDIAVFSEARTGKVILAGMIMDASQEQIAQDAAAKVPGVQSVTSKLTVYEAH